MDTAIERFLACALFIRYHRPQGAWLIQVNNRLCCMGDNSMKHLYSPITKYRTLLFFLYILN